MKRSKKRESPVHSEINLWPNAAALRDSKTCKSSNWWHRGQQRGRWRTGRWWLWSYIESLGGCAANRGPQHLREHHICMGSLAALNRWVRIMQMKSVETRSGLMARGHKTECVQETRRRVKYFPSHINMFLMLHFALFIIKNLHIFFPSETTHSVILSLSSIYYGEIKI